MIANDFDNGEKGLVVSCDLCLVTIVEQAGYHPMSCTLLGPSLHDAQAWLKLPNCTKWLTDRDGIPRQEEGMHAPFIYARTFVAVAAAYRDIF